MKLNKITQYPSDYNPLDGIDLVISCCGYEERSTSLMHFFGPDLNNVRYKKAILFDSPECEALDRNKKNFEDFGFQLHKVTPRDKFAERITLIGKLLDNVCLAEEAKVLIDYTSMNREWYSAILVYIENYLNGRCKRLECSFYYRIPIYDNTIDDNFAFSNIHPLTGYTQFDIPDKPLSLIIGLGSEEKALAGILQYADVDSEYVHYFYTNNEHIFNKTSSYQDIFSRIVDNNKHEYSLDKLIPLFNSLCDLYGVLSETNRVAIISCGPKPFTLMSLVFAKLNNVDVWKLETNISEHIVNKQASPYANVLKFEFR